MRATDPVFVVGAPRSGTSLTCGVLAACGLRLADDGQASPENPRGFYEAEIVRGIERSALRDVGADPRGQWPLPNPEARADFGRLRGALAGLNGCKLIRGALLWPSIAEAFPRARWVVVRRPDEDIAASMQRTKFMRAFNTAEGWLQHTVPVYVRRLQEIAAALDAVEVWPGTDPEAFRPAAEFLGLPFREGAVRRFILPSAWRPSTSTS